MEVKFIDLNLYNVDVEYLKYLHDADPEVYFSDAGYDKKPFLGIMVGIGTYTYFIPLTSSKKKHLRMKNAATTIISYMSSPTPENFPGTPYAVKISTTRERCSTSSRSFPYIR